MCIIPEPSKIESTKIRVGKSRDGKTNILAYQNDVAVVGTGKRVMLLPIPGTIVKIHNTAAYNNFLNESFEACSEDYKRRMANARAFGPQSDEVIVRETVGIYEVLHVNNPNLIQKGLALFPEADRPKVSDEFVDFYSKAYPDWSVVMAVFDNQDKMASQPFLVEYEGLIKSNDGVELFHVPALDNEKDGVHEGLPNVNMKVSTDHFVSLNVWPDQELLPDQEPVKVDYSQSVDQNLISDTVLYGMSKSRIPNGDWFYFIDGGQMIRTNQVLGKTLAELAA